RDKTRRSRAAPRGFQRLLRLRTQRRDSSRGRAGGSVARTQCFCSYGAATTCLAWTASAPLRRDSEERCSNRFGCGSAISQAGEYLVRMLYNERETAFKSTCNPIAPNSHYYRFDELKQCYGYQ